ncbi:uncharacterized protein DNG_02502 [Cephalotrichum gorgonifer]|uniref:Inner centromere protein ARK-binding domain-containing protein n=1 Tax=Cephalotrichum gorgonifer TaxID=2041049 RepID=A0AAE8ST50_9PEZI|nr:uncharacterized protein DNG_02502 [Cephalotrichum gorgonifer]
MATRGSRLAIGSTSWVSDERSAALQATVSEVEEFSYSVRNDFDWLNEHMAGIFDENEINVAEMFKTPGKLRGKTPRTARKQINGEARVPLSDIFSGTPRGNPSPFLERLHRVNSPSLNSNGPKNPPNALGLSPTRPLQSPQRHGMVPLADSGYHGSQSQDFDPISPDYTQNRMKSPTPARDNAYARDTPTGLYHSPTKTRLLQSPTATFTTAREEQTAKVMPDPSQQIGSLQITRAQDMTVQPEPPSSPVQMPQSPSPKRASPLKTSPVKSSPVKNQHQSPVTRKPVPTQNQLEEKEGESNDEERTHSDGSSPIRPLVRKSSLNFASLPAREPLNAGKSLGGRMSRTSHLDLKRTSYYGRTTSGKSIGNAINAAPSDDEMEIDDVTTPRKQADTEDVVAHNKSYTRRLQDQISMLGKSQPRAERPSKSIPSFAPTTPPRQPAEGSKVPSPTRKPVTPGAFPEDDDDDWIQPPTTAQPAPDALSPRPAVPPKDHSLDVAMSDATDFVVPKQRQQGSRPGSPQRPPVIPDRTTSTVPHMKSASVSALPDARQHMDEGALLKKAISVSNPTLAAVAESERPQTPKSPTRSLRESPLKHVKNKLSSILKSSRGLLASSAAISAEGKSSMLSPSTTRLGLHRNPSSQTLNDIQPVAESAYPDLTQALVNAQASRPASPSKGTVRKTRASAEREKREKLKDKETRVMEDQMDKLERAREKEAEKAQLFNKEQARIAAMEKQAMAQKEQEQEKERLVSAKGAQKPTRTSPRKTKGTTQAGDGDIEMQDETVTMQPPPSASGSRPTPGGPMRKELKRPVRPTKEAATKSKAAPTVIKVNMGPHHSQYHPSNNALSANLHEALGAGSSGPQSTGKASHFSLKSKGSMQSLKSSASSTGRPKALELAAKRKEQEEREVQRKREAKAEIERKRAAVQEEERRQEQQRRLDAEKQKEKERELAEAKKAAQRQALIEKAKQTRAPPPAVRSQPNGPPDLTLAASQESMGGPGPSRAPSRMGSALFRSQDDPSRPVNALLSNANKSQKRPLGQDNDGGNARAPVRSGPTYQSKDAKRRRTSQELDDDMETLPNIKGPPVRPSAGYKKVGLRPYPAYKTLANQMQDMPAKPMYHPGGYTAAPQGTTRDLFKSTVTSQHNSAVKASALDTTQFSKGAIPFATNPGQQAYKTPGRAGAPAGAKSATRTSPRFQNGEAIELPEIQTDDEDEDSDGDHGMMASWADSPDLRRALLRQETMDPSAVFGPPAPLNMEEVFAKSKDRWHKFRARTSSANWSGGDRLTEEDIRKDIAARDKLRREGAWTYEMSKGL